MPKRTWLGGSKFSSAGLVGSVSSSVESSSLALLEGLSSRESSFSRSLVGAESDMSGGKGFAAVRDTIATHEIRFSREQYPLLKYEYSATMSNTLLTTSYGERAAKHENAAAKLLLETMERKKSNLAVSVDLTSTSDFLRVIDTVGPYACMIKAGPIDPVCSTININDYHQRHTSISWKISPQQSSKISRSLVLNTTL